MKRLTSICLLFLSVSTPCLADSPLTTEMAGEGLVSSVIVDERDVIKQDAFKEGVRAAVKAILPTLSDLDKEELIIRLLTKDQPRKENFVGDVDFWQNTNLAPAHNYTDEELSSCNGYTVVITGLEDNGIPMMISCQDWLKQQEK